MSLTNVDRLSALQAENEDLRLRLARSEAELERQTNRNTESTGNQAQQRKAMLGSPSIYRMIVESAADYAIIAADLDGVITTWNEAAETILGWSERQVVGRPIATIFTPSDIEAGVHKKEMRLSLTEGKARDERWHMRADGTLFFASGEMMPLYDDAEDAIGYIKILRDRTSEIVAQKELAASRERLQLALDASAIVGTFDWNVQTDKVYADPRFAMAFGLSAERAMAGASLDEFVSGIHSDDQSRVIESNRIAIATGEPFIEEYRTIDVDGRLRWIFARGRCFRDGDGKPARFLGAIVDITAEKEQALRQGALLRLGDDLLKEIDPSEYSLNALMILGETLDVSRVGYARVEKDGRTAWIVNEWTAEGVGALTGSFDLFDFGRSYHAALGSGLVTIDDITKSEATAETAKRFINLSIQSLVNISVVERGQVRMVFYVHNDKPRPWSSEDIAFIRDILSRAWTYTRRRRAELELGETETRLRIAHQAAEIGTFDYDLANGKLIWDERCRAMFGVFQVASVTYENTFINGVHPDDRARVTAAVDAALDPSNPADYDIVYRTVGIEDGVVRHIQASGQTLIENGKTVRFIGAVRDVTEEKLAEERQALLTGELQHRVKNTLAMVTAIANQTIRRAANMEDGLQAFSARIAALAKAHDILVETSWTSAPMADIVEQSLLMHRPNQASRMEWSGPPLMLSARQALALSLALHELATNAAKYGALSNESGVVSIKWSLIPFENGDHAMNFEWRETGGPQVNAPDRKGFGSRLIQQTLSAEFNAELELSYEPSGLVCTMKADLAG